MLPFWPRLPTLIANLFRFPISSPDRWEDNSMVDDLEEKSSEGFDLQRYLGIVRRRHLQFLIPLFLGWAWCGVRAGCSRRATNRAR